MNEGLNEDDIQRSYLYDDGTISLLLGDAGFEIGGRFSQKMHFKEFAISDGFLSSENDGRFACRLDPGTVEAVTCDDEPSTVYIMRPAVDPHVKNAEWSEGITCSMKSSGIIPVDDSHMYLSGEKEDDSLVFRRINVKTAKSEKEYVISEDFSEEIGSHFDINNVYMYKEQNKFGYFYRNIGLIYDLDKGSFKQAFGDEDMIQNCICRNDKEGHMLAAAVIGKINENTYDRLLYPCVLNEEGEKVLLSDSPVKDLITEILCLSGDGSLLYAREDENGKCIYHIVV